MVTIRLPELPLASNSVAIAALSLQVSEAAGRPAWPARSLPLGGAAAGADGAAGPDRVVRASLAVGRRLGVRIALRLALLAGQPAQLAAGGLRTARSGHRAVGV